MRINNNMLAINTHRQLGGVALSQAKSMEKLSSGYRINRAGDDAAGLAISEKMRAQIRGLTTAAKNAQDGISLVQTAEGALQEVHGMLNRMVELATQSANGTFDDEVDRKNLESELSALKGEINRVAKSSNFNGIKLLDGSLATSASKNKVPEVIVNGLSGQDAVNGVNDVIIYEKASEAKFSGVFNVGAGTGHANLVFDDKPATDEVAKALVFFKDDSGEEHRLEVNLVAASSADKKVDWTKSSVLIDGKKVELTDTPDMVLDGTASNYNMNKALATVLNNAKGFRENFEVKNMEDATTESDGTVAKSNMLKITAKNSGTEAEVVSIALNQQDDVTHADHNKFQDVALTDVQNIKGDKITVKGELMFTLKSADLGTAGLEDAIKSATINVDGEGFIFVQKDAQSDGKMAQLLKERGFDEAHIIYSDKAGATKMTQQDVKNFATAINDRFEKKIAEAKGTDLVFESKVVKGSKNEGLTLQVGESSEDFQKITVKVNDMSAKGLGINTVSVASQDKAAASISKIREAINTVSSTRGDLGALQNRLEHTISNLNVTAENITASESRIRDVDMAKEMVELTKFNILQQAAQAMLAQANQAPQGVLQLLR